MAGKNRVRYLLEYALVRALDGAFRALPDAAGRALGRGAGRLLAGALPSRTRRAEANLAQAFPDAPPEQVRRWARECWANIGEAAWEFGALARLDDAEFCRRVALEGAEGAHESLKAGRGVILVGAHFTNWECQSRRVTLAGLPTAAIGRLIKNPYVNDFVMRRRDEAGVRAMLHRDAVKESLRWLKQGKVLGVLIDQRITDGGTRVPFFGRDAFTTILPAFLALRLGAALHPIHTWRERNGLRTRIDPAVDVSGLKPVEADVLELTRRLTAVVEGWARERPPMWLWIHDRWK
jgi:Kdo2-lipid IVA lauroyltransferase/acyltransferase